jgi:hypothetical protein
VKPCFGTSTKRSSKQEKQDEQVAEKLRGIVALLLACTV